MADFRRPLLRFQAGKRWMPLGRQTKLFAVLNLTPDSFSDGGLCPGPEQALERALMLESEGADVLDIGAESTRPGAAHLSWRQEWARMDKALPAIIRRVRIPISVDTHKPETAHAALDAGACIINDVTGLRSAKMARVVARYRASVVLMHMRGTPRTMQKNPRYGDVIKEVSLVLRRSAERALEAGIPKERILIDPGFGFGKTPAHNLEMLARLDELGRLGFGLLVGLSRKSFLGYYSGVDAPARRLAPSLGAAAAAVVRGAHVLRVHDVKPHREMLEIVDRVMGERGI